MKIKTLNPLRKVFYMGGTGFTGNPVAIQISKNGAAVADPNAGPSVLTLLDNVTGFFDLVSGDTDTPGPIAYYLVDTITLSAVFPISEMVDYVETAPAVPGDAMTLTGAYDAAKTAMQAGGNVGNVAGDVAGKVLGGGASVISGVGVGVGNVAGDVAGKILGGGAGVIAGDGVRAESVTGGIGGNLTGNVTGNVEGKVLGAGAGILSGIGVQVGDVAGVAGDIAGKVLGGGAGVLAGDGVKASAVSGDVAGKVLGGGAGVLVGFGAQVQASGISDPMFNQVPGTYPTGSAGNAIGRFLDAKVSEVSHYAGGPVESILGDVRGKVLGGGASEFTGIGVRTGTGQIVDQDKLIEAMADLARGYDAGLDLEDALKRPVFTFLRSLFS